MASILDNAAALVHDLIDSLYLDLEDKVILHRMWDAYAEVFFDLYLQAHQINNAKSVEEIAPFLYRWQITANLKFINVDESRTNQKFAHQLIFPTHERNIIQLGNMEAWWEKELLDEVATFAEGYGTITDVTDESVTIQYHSVTDFISSVDYAVERNSPEDVKYESAVIQFGKDNYRGTEVYTVQGTGALTGGIEVELKAATTSDTFTLTDVGDSYHTDSGYQVSLINKNEGGGIYQLAVSAINQRHELSHIAFTLPGATILDPENTGDIAAIPRKEDHFKTYPLEGGQQAIYELYGTVFKEETVSQDPRQWMVLEDETGTRTNHDFLEPVIVYEYDPETNIVYCDSRIINEKVIFKDNLIDLNLPYDYFGFLINFRGQNSQQYVDRLRAIWYALWHTPSPYNMTIGSSALIYAPLANRAGVVTQVDRQTQFIEIRHTDGELEHHFYDPLHSPIVVVDQEVNRFEPLTDELVICDHIKCPYWWRINYRGPHWDDDKVTLDTHLDPKPRPFDAKLTQADLLKDLQYRLHIFGVFMKISALQDGSAEAVEEFLLFYKATYTHFIIRADMILNDEMPINDDDLRTEITDTLEDIFWCFPHWDNVHSYGDLDKSLTFDSQNCQRDTLQIFIIEASYRLVDKFWKGGYLDDPADEFDDPDAVIDDTFDHENETIVIRIMDLDNGLYRFYDSMYGEVDRETAERPDRFDDAEELDGDMDDFDPLEELDTIIEMDAGNAMDENINLTWTALRDELTIQIIDA